MLKEGFIPVLFFSLFAASAVRAQEGPFVSYQLSHQSYREDIEGRGLQVGVGLGYAVSRPVSLRLRAAVGTSGTYQLAGTVEYIFLDRRYFRPFVQVGWGVDSLLIDVTSERDQVRVRGNGPEVGLGFDYFTHEQASIGLSVAERFIRYDRPNDPRFRSDLEGRSTMINLRWNVYY